MPKILLGVTGSVAAIRTPALAAGLAGLGHEVRVAATEASLHFFEPAEVGVPVYRDADEWPATRYGRGDEVLHIELRKWADLLIIAPLDANTLAKFAMGLCDNLLTSILRAWDFDRPIALAPAMNTLMWDSPITRRHLGLLLADRGDGSPSANWTLADAETVFARHAPGLSLIAPQSKLLACGDVGVGGMAEVPQILERVRQMLGDG